MQMKFYAIRHKPSGGFLPIRSRERSRVLAFTYLEPSTKYPPRLFRRKQDAKTALNWWLQGKFAWRYEHYAQEIPDLKPVKCPDRNPSDMEVVPIYLFIPEAVDEVGDPK